MSLGRKGLECKPEVFPPIKAGNSWWVWYLVPESKLLIRANGSYQKDNMKSIWRTFLGQREGNLSTQKNDAIDRNIICIKTHRFILIMYFEKVIPLPLTSKKKPSLGHHWKYSLHWFPILKMKELAFILPFLYKLLQSNQTALIEEMRILYKRILAHIEDSKKS